MKLLEFLKGLLQAMAAAHGPPRPEDYDQLTSLGLTQAEAVQAINACLALDI